ncbi:MAG: hypothetical protein QME81_18760, partial [bacterium]|nr:hypothetical protein [bacterium]
MTNSSMVGLEKVNWSQHPQKAQELLGIIKEEKSEWRENEKTKSKNPIYLFSLAFMKKMVSLWESNLRDDDNVELSLKREGDNLHIFIGCVSNDNSKVISDHDLTNFVGFDRSTVIPDQNAWLQNLKALGAISAQFGVDAYVIAKRESGNWTIEKVYTERAIDKNIISELDITSYLGKCRGPSYSPIRVTKIPPPV